MDKCIANVTRKDYTTLWRFLHLERENKSLMSILVCKEKLERLKQAARLESYDSYSEFVRKTALIEAANIISENKKKSRF